MMEDSDCEEETDQDVYTPTAVKAQEPLQSVYNSTYVQNFYLT